MPVPVLPPKTAGEVVTRCYRFKYWEFGNESEAKEK